MAGVAVGGSVFAVLVAGLWLAILSGGFLADGGLTLGSILAIFLGVSFSFGAFAAAMALFVCLLNLPGEPAPEPDPLPSVIPEEGRVLARDAEIRLAAQRISGPFAACGIAGVSLGWAYILLLAALNNGGGG